MIRTALFFIALALGSSVAFAQTEPYSTYVKNLPSAASIATGDTVWILHNNVANKTSVSILNTLSVGTTSVANGVANGLLFSGSGILQNSGPIVSAVATPSGNGQWSIGGSTANGAIITGQGSSNDFQIQNSLGAAVISVPAGTTNTVFSGGLTANSLTTGTNANALCSTAAGAFVISSGANCFAGGGGGGSVTGTGTTGQVALWSGTTALTGSNSLAFRLIPTSPTLALSLTTVLGWSTNTLSTPSSTSLYNDAATGTLALANQSAPTTGTTLRIYNSTDNVATNAAPTNFERGEIGWGPNNNIFTINSNAGGSGVVRELRLQTANNAAIVTLAPNNNKTLWCDDSQSACEVLSNRLLGFNSPGNPYTDADFFRVTAGVIAVDGGNFTGKGWLNWAGEARTAAATNYTSTTTLASLLTTTLQANRNYIFDAYVPITAGGNAGGVALSLTNPAFSAFQYDAVTFVSGTIVSTQNKPLSATLAMATASINVRGTISTTGPGTFGIQAAQSTTNATATTIPQGAWLKVHDAP